MSKIAIVTDSTAYIPQDLVERHHLTVAPQVLIWGEESFRDGVDIQPDEYYTRLRSAKVMPSTSQVSPATFKIIFQDLLAQDYEILAVLIADSLSGTIASAVQAKEMLPQDAPVTVFDSGTTAMAMGFQVLSAARAIEDGASVQEALRLLEAARGKVGVIFAVDTLEFLYRGGRIGGASRFLGTALNIKPILELTNGRVEAVERVRTRRKSLSRVVELIEERIGGRSPVRLATLHANACADAEDLLAEASARLEPVETVFSDVSPVVGTHAGPGTVGLAFMAGM